ncbi:MAG: hypothetical protein KDD48_08365 [Bdellovibrionales bacterium]|nr:hypothetical protein [Bdellovibrionales bacterium]
MKQFTMFCCLAVSLVGSSVLAQGWTDSWSGKVKVDEGRDGKGLGNAVDITKNNDGTWTADLWGAIETWTFTDGTYVFVDKQSGGKVTATKVPDLSTVPGLKNYSSDNTKAYTFQGCEGDSAFCADYSDGIVWAFAKVDGANHFIITYTLPDGTPRLLVAIEDK